METENSQRWHDRAEIGEVKAHARGLRVTMAAKAWSRMHAWCKAADSEVSGLFLVKPETGGFNCYDVFLPKQKCSSGSTDLDEDAVFGIMDTLKRRNIPQSHLRGWWHTHYNFSVFWSGTDIDTCEQLLGSSGDWNLSIVINQRGEYKCRIDVMKPFRFAVDDIKIDIEYPEYITDDKARAEVERMVTKPYAVVTGRTEYSGYGSYGYDYNPRDWPGNKYKAKHLRKLGKKNGGHHEFGDNADASSVSYGWANGRWGKRRWDDDKREWVSLELGASGYGYQSALEDKRDGRADTDGQKRIWPEDASVDEAKQQFFGFKIERDREKDGIYIIDGKDTMTGKEIIETGIATEEELKNVPIHKS